MKIIKSFKAGQDNKLNSYIKKCGELIDSTSINFFDNHIVVIVDDNRELEDLKFFQRTKLKEIRDQKWNAQLNISYYKRQIKEVKTKADIKGYQEALETNNKLIVSLEKQITNIKHLCA